MVKVHGQILEQAKVTPYGPFLQNFGVVEKSNSFNESFLTLVSLVALFHALESP